MNKLSKIFLAVIIVLIISLGITTYYWIYYRNAYFSAANQMTQLLESTGGDREIIINN